MPRLLKRMPDSRSPERLSPGGKGRIRVGSGTYTYAPAGAFRAKRPPTPIELVYSYRNAVQCVARIRAEAVSGHPLRLYTITDKSMGHKSSPYRTKALTRRQERYLSGEAHISKRLAGVDFVEEVTEHPILELFEWVNPWMNRSQLLELTQYYLDIVGINLWYLNRGTGGVPIELWPLPAWQVAVVPDYVGTDVIQRFVFTGGGGQATLDPKEVLFNRELSLFDPYTQGWSWVRGNYDAIQIYDKNLDYRDSVLSNRGRPDAMLIPKEEDGGVTIGDEAIQRITAEYEQSFALGRAGRLWVPPGGMELKPIGWTPQDMGELALGKQALHDVARAAGVPIPLVDGESANRANMDASLLQFSRFCLKPMLRKLEEHWNSNFVGLWSDRLFLAFDDPVPADKALERDTHIAYVNAGIMTRGEARSEIGKPPIEGDDEILVANNLVPLGVALEPPAPIVRQSDQSASPKPDEVPEEARGNAPEIEAPEADDDAFDEGDDSTETEVKSWEGEQSRPFGGGRTKDNSPPDRGTDGFIPNDEPDTHEDNTYGLPDGKPLRRLLKRWYRKIAREVLGTLPTIGTVVHTNWPALTDYEDPMAAAFTPMIGAYWDEAGKVTRARLGLDPDEWRVVDPHLHEKIETQAFDFCKSTLESTSETCRDAYAKLRQELLAGVLNEGEAGPELAKRVRSIFTGLTKSHAAMIARTETARAVNAASLESAKQSGVVSRKKWLLSANACEHCHEVADRVNADGGIPLDTAFATGLSDKPTYATCDAPPLHPRCRCTTTYVLTYEYQAIVDANPTATINYGPWGPEK